MRDPAGTNPVKVGMPVGPDVNPVLIGIFRVTGSLSTMVSGSTGEHYAYTKQSFSSGAQQVCTVAGRFSFAKDLPSGSNGMSVIDMSDY